MFRTATPGNASEADAAIVLNDLGVKRLLDLRSEDEFEADPGPLQSAFPEIISFTRNVDGVDDPPDPPEPLASLAEIERFVVALDDTASIGGSIYDWNTLEPLVRERLAELFPR